VFLTNECEVCGAVELNSVMDLGPHALCDDLVEIGNDKVCEKYPIEILFCDVCKTAHQKYQVEKATLFPANYHYRARMTGSVLNGMQELVSSCEDALGQLNGLKVLDVGCNDGSLLNFFSAKGCDTFGVEPTEAALDSSHPMINDFFGPSSALKVIENFGRPDIITFTNVFAHVENLPLLLEALKMLVSETTTIVIENHYLGAVLETGQFDTFYHEHPRTYSLTSFEYIARSLGLNIVKYQFVSRYGGNIRVFISNGPTVDTTVVNETSFKESFARMQLEVLEWRTDTRKLIEKLVNSHGPLPAKAFPGRAAILIELLGLDESMISAVYEIKGSVKVGHYVPGTRIPILPESTLFEKKVVGPIINLAWHIPTEVRENLRRNGFMGEVIDIKRGIE